MHCSILTDLVQTLAEFESFLDRDDVSLKASQAEEQMLAHLEHFLEVGGDRLSLK